MLVFEKKEREGKLEAGLLGDHDVVKRWKDFQMPMKLRFFAEKVYGTRVYPPWDTL